MQAVIDGTDTHQQWERWGFSAENNPPNVVDPTTRAPMSPAPATWLAALGYVPVLLQRVGLTLQQLYQLLEVQWVTNSGVTLTLGTEVVNGVTVVSAAVTAMSFAGLTADVANRAQRFLRLWTASGLQMWELDWAIGSPTATLDDTFLEFLAGARTVAAKLKLPFQEVLTFWAPLVTRDVTDHLGDEDTVVASTYTSVFATPTLQASWPTVFVSSTELSTFDLCGGDILPISNTDATANLNAVTAALGLSGSDIQAILTATGSANALKLATIAVLFRYARLARALSLSISDLLTWIQLAGELTGATIGARPSDMLELLRRIAVLRATGLAVADADYLLRGSSAAQSSVAFTTQQCSTLLQSIRDAIAKLTVAQQTSPDTATINTIAIAALATATSVTTNVISSLYAKASVTLDAPTIKALLQTLQSSTPIDPTQFPALQTAFTSIARGAALYSVLRATESEFQYLVANAGVFGWLDPSALPTSTSSPYASFETLLRAIRLNHRQAGRTPRLFDVLAAWQNAATLPDVTTAIGGSATFPSLAVALGSNATDAGAFATALTAKAPSLTPATLTGTLSDMAMLSAIADLINLAARYSLSGTTLVQLGSIPADPTAATYLAAAARGAFQAQYAQDTWLAAVQPIEDELRQTRRDALVAYLFNPNAPRPPMFPFTSTDDVFDYFLIDPEMCACSTTTRLLQASLAVQQFVQQTFLGLPIQLSIDTLSAAAKTTWSEWSWRQQFRLWQANREVFLYPENYLSPALRKDASPLFDSLASDLRQGNCDADLAEAAFENYLRGLVAASNLVIAAHYNELRADGSSVLHVFAHTRGTPYQWSYRTRTTLSSSAVGAWSAWQPLGLDIPSDQVVPVVWDQRLHLVWPIFSTMSENAATQTVPAGATSPSQVDPADTVWAIQIALSELSAGQWQAKRVFDEKMFFVRSSTKSDLDDPYINRPADAFTFRASVDATEALTISVYYNYAIQEKTYTSIKGSKGFRNIGNTKAGIAVLPSVEAPLAVTQIPPAPDPRLTPEPGSIDLAQEPTFALVKMYPPPPAGTLAVPTLYNYCGQEQSYGAYDNPPLTPVPLNILAPGTTLATVASDQELLGQTVIPRVVVAPREVASVSLDWFFVIDGGGGNVSSSPRPARTYLVESPGAIVRAVNGIGTNNGTQQQQQLNAPELIIIRGQVPRLTFSTFYHPFARTMLRELEINGVAGLMARSLQTTPQSTRGWTFDFQSTFEPQPIVATPYPGQPNASDIGESGLDFSVGSSGAYSLYNWEIFYHAPMFVAELLMQNQQYSDAMAWLEYVFDPSDPGDALSPSAPKRFWETAPLNVAATGFADQQIQQILSNAAAGDSDPVEATALETYMLDPFDPDAIANLRISAYAKATVMKFLDNLIAWGDSLFTTYTAETVNQAEQLYILADLILGERPTEVRMPPQPATQSPTYASIETELVPNSFNDPLVAVENLVVAPTPPQSLIDGTGSTTTLPNFPSTASTLLFCIPPNAQMLVYWDTVADRLYKIRHCLNLQGQAVPLPLYGPAINPLLAIQAAAAGQSITPTTQQPTLYRFATYLQRALDLTNDVRQYGSLILSALEKEDAEKLALLRATQEVDIQQRLLDVKTRQVTEATDQIAALQSQKAIAQIRYNFYSTIAFMNQWEQAAVDLDRLALVANVAATVIEAIAGPAHMVPTAEVGVAGFGGTPTVNVKFGGENVGNSATAAASWLHSGANLVSETARMAATMGGYQRRADDWQLQASLAQAEMTQIDSQITAANDRLAIAQSELSIQTETIANAQAVQTFLTNKYTNAQLYDWMVTQLTTVFTQAYQLAYSLAQTAQMAYQFELGRTDTFLQINYWDAQHRGLTAGESLLFDLRRMESQYLQNNIRERELTKHISLANTQPLALITLLQTGTCSFSLDESLFDADHPGQFFRRLRDVAITVPFVGGPYTGANGTLTLTSSVVRLTAPVAPYTPITAASPPNDTTNFRVTTPTAKQSISISNGQHDSGLFEVNLRDERFLPFEAFGAISAWSFELNPADNPFDFSTITDVVVHVRYTAYAGGDEPIVRKALPTARSIYVSTKATFSDAYFSFFHPATGATQQVLTLPFTAAQFPFSNLGAPALSSISIYVTLAAPPAGAVSLPATFGPSGGAQANISLAGSAASGISMLVATATAIGAAPQTFALTVPTATIPASLAANGVLDAAKIEDVVLVLSYTT
ncbi:MAG TPA: neuraminidase-like domain-containing protein [Kofleriaceae bacterium]|nr:neuraminidase-like domain-containing protein [Kofleriaceae bacterium]